MLDWVLRRVEGTGDAVETPIGLVPTINAIDRTGIDVDDAAMEQLLDVNQAAWEAELAMIEEHYAAVGERLPVELRRQLDDLRDRLHA